MYHHGHDPVLLLLPPLLHVVTKEIMIKYQRTKGCLLYTPSHKEMGIVFCVESKYLTIISSLVLH